MVTRDPSSPRARGLVAAALAVLAFCSPTLTACAPTGPGENPDGEPSGSAIMIGVFVRNPDGRNVYVGAVPELPSGELDYSSFLEFGDVDVSANEGYVFVWDREPGIMTRYTVAEDLSLSEGPKLSFANQGVTGSARTVYISGTRAYTLSSALDVIAVWNPETMEITGTIEMTPPTRPEGLDTLATDGFVAGDQVIWPLRSTNWDGVDYFDGAAVAIANANNEDPVQIVEDTRCVGVDGGHVDDNGDFYLRAGGYWGSSAAYAGERTCVIRIKSGERAFDDSYLVDMEELLGTYVTFPWYHVEGSKYLANAWTGDAPLPASIDDYWDGAGLEPLLVDVEAGTTEPYTDLQDTLIVSTGEFKLDGKAYFQRSDTGSAVNGTVDVVELTPTGIVEKFSLPELWALARIR